MNKNRLLSILSDFKNNVTEVNETADLILKQISPDSDNEKCPVCGDKMNRAIELRAAVKAIKYIE